LKKIRFPSHQLLILLFQQMKQLTIMKQHKNINNFNDLLDAEYGTINTNSRQAFEHEAKAAYLTDLIKSQQSKKIPINWRQMLLEHTPDISLKDLLKLLDILQVKLNFIPTAD
jgi:hypothetical protein